MTDQTNWQHAAAILFWQALMLTVLITGALWFKSDVAAAPMGPEPTVLLSAECDESSHHISTQVSAKAIKPAAKKRHHTGAGLLDISFGI